MAIYFADHAIYPEKEVVMTIADSVRASACDRGPGYRLAGSGREGAEDDRLELLEQLFDPGSREWRHRVQPGWRCLEVGAGRGSMAAWLADRVGPTGRVVATDVDLTYLSRLEVPNLEVRRHDILEDPLEVLEPGSFDVVCSRLMLFWLAGKQEAAINRMVQCLRPGGWLLDEDGDWGLAGPADSSNPNSVAYDRVYRHGRWWAARGYDPFFGRKLPMLFERSGLQRIAHRATATVVRGGSPWARWWAASLDAIRGWGLAAGDQAESSEQDHRAMIESCLDPSRWFLTQMLHACAGQRPYS